MSAENSKKSYLKGPKDKVQFNASISSSFAEAIRDYSIMEGRKIGDTVERMVSVYKGSPRHLLERLKRLKKQELTDQDRMFLREMQEAIAFLLFTD
jgi:hypothetical protein